MKNSGKIPKMIAFDLDGTVLRHDGSIGKETAKALNAAKKRGCVLVAATGRPCAELDKLLLQYVEVDFMVTSNGARISKPDGTVLYRDMLDTALLVELLSDLRLSGGYAQLMSGGRPVLERGAFRIMVRHARARGHFPLWSLFKFLLSITLVSSAEHYVKAKKTPLEKIICIFPQKETALKKQLEYRQNYGVEAVSTLGLDVEITNAGVTKGRALQMLMKELEIPAEELVAFGDSGNDVSMRVAGLLIAMENGSPQLKAAADKLAPPVWEDGVAAVLKDLWGIGTEETK